MTKMLSRAGRASVFDRKAFNEAFFDNDAVADGAIIVALVGAAIYVGRAVVVSGLGLTIEGLLATLVGNVAGWLILGFATWFAASRLFGAGTRPQNLLALHGLGAPPLLLEILGGLAAALGLVWYLAVLVVATQEGTELPLRQAAVSVLIGFAAAIIVRSLLRVPFGMFGGLVG